MLNSAKPARPATTRTGNPNIKAVGPKQPVWDLPTRLFHWLLVALIALSWWSAEEHQYDLHLWSGMAVVSLILFRLLWGLFGSTTARFANFVRGPSAIRAYLRGDWRGIGHNPIGALSVLALLGLVAVEAGMGLFASDEDGLLIGPLSGFITGQASEGMAELHEDFFNILLVFIGIHVAAILFYWIAKKQNLIGPMVTGRAELDPDAEPMRPARWWVAMLCVILALAITRWVIAGLPPFSS